ncbi:MAG: SDR family NAD(P)-dependent oxidoreductase [Pseudomonadota bacterium]|nr:SDR family NAD(P)-dependent oxidoreductase [Pseudomonadota bacterium]
MSGDIFRLYGKRALVTGAGRGIGLAIARAYAERGAAVTLCARSEDEVTAAAENLRARGLDAEAMVADVTDIAAFTALIEARPAFHVLVNNAGTNRPRPLTELTAEDYDLIMGLNLRAAIFVLQAVTRRMLGEGIAGSIINMSSQMGHVGAASRALYCASKWGLEGFTKAAAIELGPHNIRVNTICPTFIDTPLTRPYFKDTAFREEVLSKIKLGRLGTVDDIIGAAIFLASDASNLMTGSALMLDGGWSAG